MERVNKKYGMVDTMIVDYTQGSDGQGRIVSSQKAVELLNMQDEEINFYKSHLEILSLIQRELNNNGVITQEKYDEINDYCYNKYKGNVL